MDQPRYPLHELQAFSKNVFLKLGCNEANATTGAEVLAESDKRGIDSHGIARLHNYVHWLTGKFAPANPEVAIIRQSGSTALVDGGGGLGIMVAPIANKICIEKTLASGTAWVNVRNSNHFGIAGYYTNLAAEKNLVGWAMSNATAQVAPARSKQPMLGTNPFSVAIPNPGKFPLMIDMATSAVAYGKIEIAKRENAKMPIGWALNHLGEHTTNPFEIGGKQKYSMLPVGSVKEHGVHKGYCLSAMADLLSGVLGDAAFGPFGPHFMVPEISPSPLFGPGLGHMFGAFQVEAFSDIESYQARIKEWISAFKRAEPIDENEPVLVPGEPEQFAMADRLLNGVPLNPEVVRSLRTISKDLGVAFD